MAQGKMKVKAANVQRKGKRDAKQPGPKKGGGRSIAPKKSQKIKEKNIRKTLEKSINASIEQEFANKAGTKSLSVVRSLSTEDDASNKGETEKTKTTKK